MSEREARVLWLGGLFLTFISAFCQLLATLAVLQPSNNHALERTDFSYCLPAEVVDEADSKGEYVVAKVDGSVHIKDIELFFVENSGIGILECHFSSPFYKYFLKYYITDLIFLQEFDIISV
jgi:hypothetical protein